MLYEALSLKRILLVKAVLTTLLPPMVDLDTANTHTQTDTHTHNTQHTTHNTQHTQHTHTHTHEGTQSPRTTYLAHEVLARAVCALKHVRPCGFSRQTK